MLSAAWIARPARPVPQAGFSMIEVLVVIVVLAFGMLGIAGLQASTVKFKINSWARSAASVQFSDLADRVRANPAQAGPPFGQAAAGEPASTYVLQRSWTDQQADTLSLPTDCLAMECTAEQRAAYDMLAWRARVRRSFPQGAAVVTGNRATGITATIAWFDRQFTTAAGTLDRSAVCSGTSSGAESANCCPAALGNPAPAGVRCTNATFIP
jgi:type IV pilus assembly protein PilV